jgi:hypothetical protein
LHGNPTAHPQGARIAHRRFETAIIERYRRRESSVEEALIESALTPNGRRSRHMDELRHLVQRRRGPGG